MARCCIVLGDQLSHSLPSLASLNDDDTVLMAEVMREATYIKHHKQKIALVFSAMRHFCSELRASGRRVIYVSIDDDDNTGDLMSEIERIQHRELFSGWVATQPGEWRLLEALKSLKNRLAVPLELIEDNRFLTSHQAFSDFLANRKQPRMEHFYRIIRRQTGLLMDNTEPEGGKWNYDRDNRKSFSGGTTPALPRWEPDEITTDVFSLVEQRFTSHFGSLETFFWPVTRAQAQELLCHFIEHCLPSFGDYQDALVADNDILYHSLLSTSLNLGLLGPLEVCQAAETAYRKGDVPLNAVEGFIRQIIGWREYVRGIYWAFMPEYKARNFLEANWALPDFYWDETKTNMRCMKEALRNTRQHAYAHHIQRLMITGNFALIAGCCVEEVTDWYLSVYADAFEWVELPNTLGMALFADGGIMGSKPYCASGAYIERMSDYCKGCAYSVKDKVGENACPFNFLYWDFLAQHRDTFKKNPRMALTLKNLDRMDVEALSAIRKQANDFRMRVETTGSDQIVPSQATLL